jgi:hypothetical protein
VSGLGVLFALTADDSAALLVLVGDDDAVVGHVSEDIEERLTGDDHAALDKSWDAIHRCLTDGELTYENGTFPLNRCILGGRMLLSDDAEEIAVFTHANDVPTVSAALDGLTEEWFRKAYGSLDPEDYLEQGPEDYTYTWDGFESARRLWRHAATTGRSVLFSAS